MNNPDPSAPNDGASAIQETQTRSQQQDRMAEATILSAHYVQVRDNILLFVKTRDQYIYFTFAAAGAVLSYALADPSHVRLLFILPLICVISAIFYAQAETTIGTMCRWLKVDYSAETERLFGTKIQHWDDAGVEKLFFSPTVFGRRSTALALTYATTTLGGLYLLVEHYALEVGSEGLSEIVIAGVPRGVFLALFLVIYVGLSIFAIYVAAGIGRLRSDIHLGTRVGDED